MKNISSKRAIVWDWNGTLLNDVDVCVNCMNILLLNRNIPGLTNQQYKRIFTFPVKEYYKKAGFRFDLEPFEKPALEFIELYHKNLSNAKLFPEVKKILSYFKRKGIIQLVLSAMEHQSLVKSLTDKGIHEHFDEISGINNHYAHSKLEIGQNLIKRINLPMKAMILIGDSLHDLEVADELGIDHLLIANGHQSIDRLLEKTPNVVSKIQEIINIIR